MDFKRATRTLILFIAVFVLVATGAAQPFLTNGLVAYWPFSGNANDASGRGHNGTVAGAVLTTDRFGNSNSAYYFNGASDIDVASSTDFDWYPAQGMTVSVWTYSTAQNSSADLLQRRNNNNNFWQVGTGVNALSGLPTNRWTQLVWTSSPTFQNYYTNGIWCQGYTSGLIPTTAVTNGVDVLIGGSALYGAFTGDLDDIRIYNRILSTNEIQQLYAVESELGGCSSPPAGLVSWWPAAGNANDIAGVNNGVAIGGVTYAGGEVGQAFNLNGTNQYIDIPNSSSISPSNSLTLEAWVYPSEFPGSAPIFKKAGEGTQQQHGYSLQIDQSRGLGFWVYISGGTGWVGSSFTSVPSNQWSHVAGVYDGTNLYLYLNGVAVGSPVYAPGQIVSSGNDLQIGHDPSAPVWYFGGLIDEASLYNTALSAAQIQSIYAAGGAGKCTDGPIISGQPQNQTVLAGGMATFTVTAGGLRPLYYQWQLDGTNISTGTNLTATNATLVLTNVQLSESGNLYSVVVSNWAGAATSSNALLTVLPVPSCAPVSPGLVSWWPADGAANDIVGTNNGTTVGGVTYAPGEVGQAFALNGTNQYIDVPRSLSISPSNSLTLEAWVYPTELPGSAPVFKKAGEGTEQQDGYSLQIDQSRGLGFYVYLSGGTGWVGSANVAVPTNQWSHVAGVYDGTNLYVYLNGVAVGSPVNAPGQIVSSGNDLQIGHDPSAPVWYFGGLIDEPSLYNTALSAAQIQAIYEAASTGKCIGPPVITAQPQNQAVTAGNSAVFSVNASGIQPLSYQWFENQTNLAGATNATLVLTNTQLEDSGNFYSVLVTNLTGSTNSSNAVLSVSAPICDSSASGLVGWWAGEGNAYDSVGTNNGSLQGGVTFTNGKVGQAFSFNGSNSVQVPDAPGLDYTGKSPMTLELWVYRSGTQTPMQIAGKRNPGCGSLEYQMAWDTNNGGISFGGNSVGVLSGADLPSNVWMHLAGTYDGTNFLLYTNGVLAGSTNGNLGPSNSAPFTIGDTGGCSGFVGLIDEVSLYNRALSAAEILAIYNAGAAGKCELPRDAKATAIITNGAISGAIITDIGFGYTNTPAVKIIGGGGSGAQAVAVVSNGVVVGLSFSNGGSGYTNTPLIVIDPPIIPNPVLGIVPVTFLSFSNLATGGAYQLQQFVGWYWSNDPVSFMATNVTYTDIVSGAADNVDYRLASNPVPAQAFATAQLVNGFVVGATVNAGGSGYFTSPTVAIVGGGGTNATAISQVSLAGVVTNIHITGAGIGYTSLPIIEISPPPVTAFTPTVIPMIRLDSSSLAPYDNYQVLFTTDLNATWANWSDGLFTPTAVTNSQYLYVTNNTAFFRLQYLP